jgi:hypothetical protein
MVFQMVSIRHFWFLATKVDVVSGVGRGAQLSEGSMKTGTVQLLIPLDSLTGR